MVRIHGTRPQQLRQDMGIRDADRNATARRHPTYRWPRWSGLALALALAASVACSPAGAGSQPAPGPRAGQAGTQQVPGAVAAVGQPAPGFQVTTIDGLMLTSTDLIAQQKPYILYFFASW